MNKPLLTKEQRYQKSIKLDEYTNVEIRTVQKKLNKRPRKRLQFNAPIHLFYSSLSRPSCTHNLN